MTTLGPIGEAIKDLSESERATRKGLELAKLGPLARTTCRDFDIEILSCEAIDRGLQVFARAWDNEGQQVGFGDGTVDIERFRIINPPILVPDGTQTLEEWEGKPVLVDNYIEDLETALLLSLEHTVRVSPRRQGKRIIPGKVGNTTTTVYAHSSDGATEENQAGGVTWATLVGGAGTGTAVLTASAGAPVQILPNASADKWNRLRRGAFNFDTSGIPDTDSISAATFSIFGVSKQDLNSNAPNLNVYSYAPASDTVTAAGDFDSYGTTAFSTSITYAGYSTTAYNDFALNASGLAVIDKTGYTNLGLRNANFDVANSAPTWAASSDMEFQCNFSEQAGTANDPVLVVTHAAPGAGGFTAGTLLFMGAG